MAKFIGSTNLTYLWGKIKSFVSKATVNRAVRIPFGVVDSTSVATAFTATVDGIPMYDAETSPTLADGTCVYLSNPVIASAAKSTAPKCWTLNVNGYGAKPVYVTTAAATYSTTHFAKNYKMLFTYDDSLDSGKGGWYIGQLFNSNTTYSDMTQAEINAGTGTTGRKITPKMLRDNFYTEDEVDGLLDDKQDTIDDLADIRSGAALGATALQSFTESDPTVPAWAKASSKPTYTASEVGALPSTTTIPSKTSDLTNDSGFITSSSLPTKVSDLTNDAGYITDYTETDPVFTASAAHGITSNDISNWNSKTSNVGTITGINMNGASKGTSGVVDLGTVITAHQDISGKADKATTLAGYGITDAINTSSTAQTKSGNLTAAKFVTSGGTSSQFVKGDGSLDNTAYGTYSKPSGGIPKTDLASAVQTSLGLADSSIQDISVDQGSVSSGTLTINLANNIGRYGLTTLTDNIENVSNKALTPGGLYNYKATVDIALAGKQATLTFDSAPIENSSNPVTSGGVYTALQNVEIDVDDSLSSNSENPVQNKIVKAALDAKQATLVSGTNIKTINGNSIVGSGDVELTLGDENVQSDWNQTTTTADDYIKNKPTIPSTLAELAEDSSHKVVSQTSITTWNDKAEKVTQVNHGTSDTTYTITPNVLHVWGEVTALILTLGTGESGVVNEYMFQFYSGSTPTTLTLPNSVIWVQPLTTQAGKTYQVSIVNNLACYITDGMVAAESSGGTPTYATQAWVTSLIDSVPTANSSNVPSSGGTYAMIEGGYYYS